MMQMPLRTVSALLLAAAMLAPCAAQFRTEPAPSTTLSTQPLRLNLDSRLGSGSQTPPSATFRREAAPGEQAMEEARGKLPSWVNVETKDQRPAGGPCQGALCYDNQGRGHVQQPHRVGQQPGQNCTQLPGGTRHCR